MVIGGINNFVNICVILYLEIKLSGGSNN